MISSSLCNLNVCSLSFKVIKNKAKDYTQSIDSRKQFVAFYEQQHFYIIHNTENGASRGFSAKIAPHSTMSSPKTTVSHMPLLLASYVKFTDRTAFIAANNIIPSVTITTRDLHAHLMFSTPITVTRLSRIPVGVGQSWHCRVGRYSDEHGVTTRVNALSSRPDVQPRVAGRRASTQPRP